MASEVDHPMLLVRLRRGVVGETKRTCHLVPTPNGDAMPETLIALCGEVIKPGTAELLDTPSGMPCVGCLFRSPSGRAAIGGEQ